VTEDDFLCCGHIPGQQIKISQDKTGNFFKTANTEPTVSLLDKQPIPTLIIVEVFSRSHYRNGAIDQLSDCQDSTTKPASKTTKMSFGFIHWRWL